MDNPRTDITKAYAHPWVLNPTITDVDVGDTIAAADINGYPNIDDLRGNK